MGLIDMAKEWWNEKPESPERQEITEYVLSHGWDLYEWNQALADVADVRDI